MSKASVSVILSSLILLCGFTGISNAQINPTVDWGCEDQIEFDIFAFNNSSGPTPIFCWFNNPTLYEETITVVVENGDTNLVATLDPHTNYSLLNIGVNIVPEFSESHQQYSISVSITEANGEPCGSCYSESRLLDLYPKWGGEYVRFGFEHGNHSGTFDMEWIPQQAPNTVASLLGHVDSNHLVGKTFDMISGGHLDGAYVAWQGQMEGTGNLGHSGEWFGYCNFEPSTSSFCNGEGQTAWNAPLDEGKLPGLPYSWYMATERVNGME